MHRFHSRLGKEALGEVKSIREERFRIVGIRDAQMSRNNSEACIRAYLQYYPKGRHFSWPFYQNVWIRLKTSVGCQASVADISVGLMPGNSYSGGLRRQLELDFLLKSDVTDWEAKSSRDIHLGYPRYAFSIPFYPCRYLENTAVSSFPRRLA